MSTVKFASKVEAERRRGSQVMAYLRLLRIPNVFTAMADVMMGFLLTHTSLAPWSVFLPLAAASCLIYMAGMVLNDVFDHEVDAIERPERPIPSGRIRLGTARWLGFELLVVGVAMAWLAGSLGGRIATGSVATLLAVAVIGYDAWLKRTPAGPVAMGSCRMLNVLLGVSAGGGLAHPVFWCIAIGIGTYIVGVTWFARTEAKQSNSVALAAGLAVAFTGIALLAGFPYLIDDALPTINQLRMPHAAWLLLVGMLAFSIGRRAIPAVFNPTPANVQAAVKLCIFSLIVLDAAVVLAVRGPFWGVCVLSLLVPTTLLGRWFRAT